MLALLASGRAFVMKCDQLLRYFSVGIINSAVGYGLYALFFALINNVYIAQIVSHCIGMCFNYVMLKTHVFRGGTPSTPRYIAAYIVSYILGLGFLYVFNHILRSPYLAGLLSLITVASINYFVLRSFVFRA
jgi:putative flippase GtrA